MKKALTTILVAGTMAIAAVAAPAPAQARNEGAVAAGVIGGLAVGALIASSANRSYAYAPGPVYYYDEPAYRHCYITRQQVWTYYGPRWQRVRVCD